MPALMIVDMQQDFVSPDGAACVAQALPSVPAIAAALAHAREQGWPVIHVVREHDPAGLNTEPFRKGRPVCVSGTWGAEIVPELTPVEGELVVVKTRFSAFYQTALDEVLNSLNWPEIILCGTQLPNCLRATVHDAVNRDLPLSVLVEGCSAQNQAVADANLEDMANFGVKLLSLADCLALNDPN
ncbi:cysteine hydrolase family protein [Ferrimonas balearica]|uniref:cysteine hydrolase family protein n=1 Tax=Ferrimonas balearica TaxID=44012 RepID=UPI001C93F3D8|nr:isochorismatase family cysteine hydrolase [Ferrimonas balearica]MBY6224018.1 cysteine hydrolase [Ferrimonas balearica]